MKQFFSILCLLSVIAFTSVHAYEKAPQFEYSIDQGSHFTDIAGDFADLTAVPVYSIEYVPDIQLNAILIKEIREFVPPILNPNPGLKYYSWEQDKRESIRQNCRSNC